MINLTKETNNELNYNEPEPIDLSDFDETAIKKRTKANNIFVLLTIVTFTVMSIIALLIGVIVYVITNNIANTDTTAVTYNIYDSVKPLLKYLLPIIGLTLTISSIADITKTLLNPWKEINGISCMTRIILGGALISSSFGILLHR